MLGSRYKPKSKEVNMKIKPIKQAAFAMMLTALFLTVSLNGQSPNVREVEDRMLKQANENIEKYRKGPAKIQFKGVDGKGINNAKVEIVQKTHDFLFGSVIFDLTGGQSAYREDLFKMRFSKIFNLAVFPFYWASYESQQGMPNFQRMLPVIEWCRSQGITTKGHPLVWANNSGYPQWLKNYSASEAEEFLKGRVINTVAGFKGKIDIWDVVNEPIHVQTWENAMKRGSRPSIPDVADYVEKALHWANSANPSATLIVNEYFTLAMKNDRERFDSLLKELDKRKAPLSNIGLQAHEPRDEWFTPEVVWSTFDLYARYGHSIHITEFTPQSSGKEITGGWRTGTWTPEAQRDFTEQFVRLCFGHPAVVSINWWGLSDRNIWLPGGGLIDEEYRPKPVYNMLDSLINIEWKTRVSLTPDRNGEIAFNGFYGEYEILLTTANGRVHNYPLHIRKDEENKWVFIVKE